MKDKERIVVVYHAHCPDGFGGAFAAWKKFGEHAEYLPLSYNDPVPEVFAGATVYFIDFCYTEEIMRRIETLSARLIVLDHHAGTKDVVEGMKEHLYDETRSGATIAWTYFHPEKRVPVLLKYVEAGDLYRFDLVHARELLAYIYNQPFTFESWERLQKEVEHKGERQKMIERGTAYVEYKASVLSQLIAEADRVLFEGHEVFLSPSLRLFTSDLGNQLAKKQGPFALMLQARPDGLRVSLRGDGSVDVAEIARKYGGNGHPNAAAFSLPYGTPIPWTRVPHEDTRH